MTSLLLKYFKKKIAVSDGCICFISIHSIEFLDPVLALLSKFYHTFYYHKMKMNAEVVSIAIIGGSKGRGRQGRAPRVKILSFLCSFRQK